MPPTTGNHAVITRVLSALPVTRNQHTLHSGHSRTQSTASPVLRWYAYGLGPNAVLSQINVGAGTRDTQIPNLLGSIAGSYGSTGTLTKYGYQPYGNGAAAPQFAYTGQRIDPEIGGLYYYRARHYSTTFGRFLQPDPIGYSAGLHLYGYVANDPLNGLDPDGLWWEAVSGAFQNLTRSDFAATAGSLLQTMADPWVGFYQRSIVGTINTAASFAPALVDPGFYASIQGAGLPGAVVGGVGYATTSAIAAVTRFARGGSSSIPGLGPVAGGGANLENLTAGEIARIQNAANRTGTEISVVGSRARGTANPNSDWDYVLPPGTRGSTRHSLSSSLPEGPRSLGEPRNLEFFVEPLDTARPFITFTPAPR